MSQTFLSVDGLSEQLIISLLWFIFTEWYVPLLIIFPFFIIYYVLIEVKVTLILNPNPIHDDIFFCSFCFLFMDDFGDCLHEVYLKTKILV